MNAFGRFNIIQFIASLNENYFRFLIAFFLISLRGEDSVSLTMAETGAVFLVPFLIFSTPGGLFADKFSKQKVMLFTRILECILLLFSMLAIALDSIAGAFVLLFLMSSSSALFGPAKYGLIPELAAEHRFFQANSIIAAFTFLGIILGTGLASFIAEVTNQHYILAALLSAILALIAIVISFTVPTTPSHDPKKRIDAFLYKEIFMSIIEMQRISKLYPAVLAYAYFLLLGAFLQLNIVPFATTVLGLEPLFGGYLFLLTSVGIGIGAFLAPKFSKHEINLNLIPISGIGISVFLFILAFNVESLWLTSLWLIIIGTFGGLFLVPSQAYILKMSPDQSRGVNFSTANFLSFLFALGAPLLIFLFNTKFHLSPDVSFALFAVFNFLIMIYFLRKFKDNKAAAL